MNNLNERYFFSKIPIKAYFIFFVFLLLLLILGIASAFPFLSERKFRDAFHFGIYKRHKFVIEDMKQAIDYSPWESHYMISLGRDYQNYYFSLKNEDQQLKVLKELEKLYKQVLLYDKHNPWVYLYLSNVYMLFKKHYPDQGSFYDLRVDHSYKKMVEIGFLNPLFVLNYAIYQHKTKNNLKEAKVFYERVISYDKSMGDAYFGLSNIYAVNQEYKKATGILEDLYKVNPRYRGIVITLSNIYLQQRNYDQCEQILLAENNIQPNQENILQYLVKLYYSQEKFDQAVTYLDKLYQFFPKQEPKMFYCYIDSLHKSKRYSKAYSLLLGYLLKYPNDKFADQWLKKIKKSL